MQLISMISIDKQRINKKIKVSNDTEAKDNQKTGAEALTQWQWNTFLSACDLVLGTEHIFNHRPWHNNFRMNTESYVSMFSIMDEN